jgi:hypothetical protein
MNATDTDILLPDLFTPSPYLSDEINRNIIQSEIEGGVYLRDLPCGAVLRIETHDWTCTMIYCDDGDALISGHPVFCPALVKVHVSGSTWGGSMLKQSFIGRGMHLEMLHPRHGVIITSPIIDIQSYDLSDVLHGALQILEPYHRLRAGQAG